jgi:hypothetical protein
MTPRLLALIAIILIAVGWGLLIMSKRKRQPLYSISIGLFSGGVLVLALRSGRLHFDSHAAGAGSEMIGYASLAIAGFVTAFILFFSNRS